MSGRILILFAVLSAAVPVWGANPARYVARFSNGSFVEGNTLSDWHSPESTPKLEKQPLFDPGNPIRWLIDRTQPPAAAMPDAFVEMTTGDRLPGTVTDYRTGDESPFQVLPPHLVVAYPGPSAGSLENQSNTVRVDARFVRKVQWANGGTERWTPKTIYLRDGTFLPFRAIRWAPGGVSALLETGPRRLSFSEIAQVHLPASDFWTGYLDELAALAPEGNQRLVQLEAVEGTIITTSLARTVPRVHGDAKDVSRWLLGVQPAWSLDLIWLWQGTIRARRSFAPHEVPLTRVTLQRVEHRSAFDFFRGRLGTNRNLQGHPLRAVTREAGWGFAVQAFSELEFDLPAMARSIRADFSLDASSGSGGCVQARILNASAGNASIYQSPIVIGAETVTDTGAVAIHGNGDAPRRIILQVDPVLTNRPPNADPFDVRDQANWLDPFVEFDGGALKQQLDARASRLQHAWRGWEFAIEPGGQLVNANVLAEFGNSGEFRLGATVSGNGMKLTKHHSVSPNDRWLVVDAVRLVPPGSPCKLSVKVGDAMPVEWDLPNYDKSRSDFRPLIIPLEAHSTKSLDIEIKMSGTSERVPVLWRAIAIVQQHPMFYQLFEDDVDMNKLDVTVNVSSTESDQSHTGKRLINFASGSDVKIQLTKPIVIRERPQLGEYRFLRFAIRKRGGGGMRIGLQRSGTGDQLPGYIAGPKTEEDVLAKRIFDQAIPEQWQLITRDLYSDFGDFQLSSLTFQALEGEQAFVDHVYLARTQSDFELIKQVLPPK